MILTLQVYITRELLKTFALTAIGLTLTFSLCGGVMNMIQVEVLTAVEVMRILTFVLPIATTLTLPVAALFACAVVYGRFAADNEFDACKASGINIQRLLLPAAGLSLLTAGFTFTFANFVIPSFIAGLQAMVRKDIQKIVASALTTQRHLKYGDYVLYARYCRPIGDGAELKALHVEQAAFLMFDHDELTHCGTAEEVYVEFRGEAERDRPTVEAAMHNVLALDVRHRRLDELPRQRFNPVAIPSRIDFDLQWLTLRELMHFRTRPVELPQITGQLERLRQLTRDMVFYQHAYRQVTGPEKVLRLGEGERRYEIRAARAEQDPDNLRVQLQGVVIRQWWDGRRRDFRADRCTLRVKRGFAEVPDSVHMTLTGQVRWTDAADPSRVNEPKEFALESPPVPAAVLARADAISTAELLGLPCREDGRLDPSPALAGGLKIPSLELGRMLDDARRGLLAEVVKQTLKIRSIIHSRLAFSASAMVTLVLAAGLAIVFRGGQLLTAFIISFFPGLMVVVMNIMGRQLSENAATHFVGLGVIWAGIGLLAAADVVVLTRLLRR